MSCVFVLFLFPASFTMSAAILTYFPSKGRADAICFALELAGVKYENNRFNRNDWPTIKAEGLKDRSLLYGQVPRLHIDGMDLVETGAIMRYIGRKYNLLGETPETNAFGDMAYEGFVDCLNNYFKAVFSPNPEDKVNYYSKTLETFLSAFEYVFGKYEGPFILGEKPTMYDCMAYSVLDIVLTNAPSPISNPVIEKFMDAFKNVPAIKDFIESGRRI